MGVEMRLSIVQESGSCDLAELNASKAARREEDIVPGRLLAMWVGLKGWGNGGEMGVINAELGDGSVVIN